MNSCRFVSASPGYFLARFAICISTVNIFSMSLVHLMFLKCSSVNRHPPSLLSGFHGTDFPPFNQYYEDAKTASALLLSCDFSWSGYLPIPPFLIACQGGDIYPVSPDCWDSVNPL